MIPKCKLALSSDFGSRRLLTRPSLLFCIPWSCWPRNQNPKGKSGSFLSNVNVIQCAIVFTNKLDTLHLLWFGMEGRLQGGTWMLPKTRISSLWRAGSEWRHFIQTSIRFMVTTHPGGSSSTLPFIKMNRTNKVASINYQNILLEKI